MKQIYMTSTGSKDGPSEPTLMIETGGPDDADKFIMVGAFPDLFCTRDAMIAHGNGEGGIDPEEPTAQRLLELLADDLGYNLVKK